MAGSDPGFRTAFGAIGPSHASQKRPSAQREGDLIVREWVSNAIDTLSVDPYLQGVIVACCTFILEDPTTLASALLVADGRMLYWTALIGLSMGIGIGDWGLYALGRFMGPKTLAWGLVSERRLERAGAWFERNLVVAIFVSRFVPGLRLPMNIGAGMIQASPAYTDYQTTVRAYENLVRESLTDQCRENLATVPQRHLAMTDPILQAVLTRSTPGGR